MTDVRVRFVCVCGETGEMFFAVLWSGKPAHLSERGTTTRRSAPTGTVQRGAPRTGRFLYERSTTQGSNLPARL